MPAALNFASMVRGLRRSVRFEWLKTRPVDDAVWRSAACMLRDTETTEYVEDAFGIVRSEVSIW
jgi:hypothetical protein